MMHGPFRTAAVLASTVLAVGGMTGAARPGTEAEVAASQPIYFVHGYNDNESSNCASLWGKALDYFQERGKDRDSLRTVAYYSGDKECDVDIANASTDTRIKHIAAALANRIHSEDESVEIVAHSMGGLISRVAMLGSAKGWAGFPKGRLKVDDIVTLATPHQGIQSANKYDSVQWDSMVPGSEFLTVLNESANRLDQEWADGTDWSFAGSDEDETVSKDSAIDEGHHADHKYRYFRDQDHDISHTNIRRLAPGGGKYNLRYWHSSEGTPHDTTNGWAPLETAYNALSRNGDW